MTVNLYLSKGKLISLVEVIVVVVVVAVAVVVVVVEIQIWLSQVHIQDRNTTTPRL